MEDSSCASAPMVNPCSWPVSDILRMKGEPLSKSTDPCNLGGGEWYQLLWIWNHFPDRWVKPSSAFRVCGMSIVSQQKARVRWKIGLKPQSLWTNERILGLHFTNRDKLCSRMKAGPGCHSGCWWMLTVWPGTLPTHATAPPQLQWPFPVSKVFYLLLPAKCTLRCAPEKGWGHWPYHSEQGVTGRQRSKMLMCQKRYSWTW